MTRIAIVSQSRRGIAVPADPDAVGSFRDLRRVFEYIAEDFDE